MHDHIILDLIRQADQAIMAEDSDAPVQFYADHAVLVVQPGQFARGTPQVRKAFEAIAMRFETALTVTQGDAPMMEGAGTALVTKETPLFVQDADDPVKRRATSVFAPTQTGNWLCAIDDAYGADLPEVGN